MLAMLCAAGAVWGGYWLLLIPAALLQLANGVLFLCPRCGLDLSAYGPGPIHGIWEMNFKPFPSECPRCGRSRMDVRPAQRLRAPESGTSV
jgi:predicted RNA-binding Zn-ribbon protein involved in translation (DUF1610 family)